MSEVWEDWFSLQVLNGEDELFWNLTNGVRPPEPVPGLFAGVCESIGRHVYDATYGSRECARCGYQTPRTRLRDRLVRRLQ